MRSNLKTLLLTAVACVATSGCSYLFGPKADDTKPFVKSDSNSCLKDMSANIQGWLGDGKTDIGRSVDCAVGALEDFSQHVRGQTKSIYTKAELAEFIAEFLTAADSPNAGETTTQTEEILRVKQILLGGASDMITRDEIARLKSLLLRARPLLVGVSPSIQLLLFKQTSATSAQVTTARESLTKILDLIADEFDAHNEGRPEAGFQDLLTSARKLGLENEAVQSWIPVAESLKVLILGGEPSQLRGREWAPLIRTIGQGWGLALRAKYNLRGNPDMLGGDFPMLEGSIREIVGLMGKAVDSHDGAIPNAAFENLIDALQAKSMTPFGLQPETLKRLLPVVFGKLLYGRSLPDWDRHSLHFGTEQLAKLREIANDYLAGQTIVNQIYGTRPAMTIVDFGRDLAANKPVQKDFVDQPTLRMAARAQSQLLTFMAKGRPPIHDDQGRMIVKTKKDLPPMRKSDLDSINMVRVLVSSVLQGWTHDRSASETIAGLLEGEVQEAYLDFRDLGHDLNFIDIRSSSAGTRTFMENAIFMSSSDGNDRMGLQEGVEWFHFVMSGGMIADDLYKRILEHRWSKDGQVCAVAKIDVLGQPKQRPDCFREGFLKEWAEFMPNLPRLVSWVKSDGSGDRGRRLMTALENAGRTRGASQEFVDSSEFRSMVPILHYLESIFARFDTNQDAVLANDEVWKAFPLLAPFIKKIGNGAADDEKVQKAVLSWILKFGTLPDTSLVGKAKLMGWYMIYDWFSLESDRERILQVISSFAQAAKNTRAKTISDYYNANKGSLRALLLAREPQTVAKLTEMFQCLAGGAPSLGRDMKANIDALVPAKEKIGADDFIARMKRVIDADSGLEPYCLPF